MPGIVINCKDNKKVTVTVGALMMSPIFSEMFSFYDEEELKENEFDMENYSSVSIELMFKLADIPHTEEEKYMFVRLLNRPCVEKPLIMDENGLMLATEHYSMYAYVHKLPIQSYEDDEEIDEESDAEFEPLIEEVKEMENSNDKMEFSEEVEVNKETHDDSEDSTIQNPYGGLTEDERKMKSLQNMRSVEFLNYPPSREMQLKIGQIELQLFQLSLKEKVDFALAIDCYELTNLSQISGNLLASAIVKEADGKFYSTDS
uniref:BTB domain-containing protein n=1 Tax=Rhabditophanes sp. KR3021 TaxID=114890 RepID=A0AC35U287_9BILA